MAKKILLNRTPKVIGLEGIARSRVLVKELMDILGNDTIMPDEDYKAQIKISDKRKLQADDSFEIAQVFTELLEESLTVKEVNFEKSYYEDADTIRSIAKPFFDKLDKEQNIAGSQYYNAMALFDENVKYKAGRDNSRAQLAAKQISDLNRKQGGSNGGKKDLPKS